MNLYAFSFEGVKCDGCNWEVTDLFVLARNWREAQGLLKKDLAGLCGTCMCEMLASEKYEIELPRRVQRALKKRLERRLRNEGKG